MNDRLLLSLVSCLVSASLLCDPVVARAVESGAPRPQPTPACFSVQTLSVALAVFSHDAIDEAAAISLSKKAKEAQTFRAAPRRPYFSWDWKRLGGLVAATLSAVLIVPPSVYSENGFRGPRDFPAWLWILAGAEALITLRLVITLLDPYLTLSPHAKLLRKLSALRELPASGNLPRRIEAAAWLYTDKCLLAIGQRMRWQPSVVVVFEALGFDPQFKIGEITEEGLLQVVERYMNSGTHASSTGAITRKFEGDFSAESVQRAIRAARFPHQKQPENKDQAKVTAPPKVVGFEEAGFIASLVAAGVGSLVSRWDVSIENAMSVPLIAFSATAWVLVLAAICLHVFKMVRDDKNPDDRDLNIFINFIAWFMVALVALSTKKHVDRFWDAPWDLRHEFGVDHLRASIALMIGYAAYQLRSYFSLGGGNDGSKTASSWKLLRRDVSKPDDPDSSSRAQRVAA